MHSTLTSVGVWNRINCYLAAPTPEFHYPKGVNDFAFLVGTNGDEETNKLCVLLLLVLECGIVTSSIMLHLSLSPLSSLCKGVNDFALLVGTRVKEETN